MGYKEAKEDRVKVASDGYFNWYYPKCSICGSLMKSMTYNRNTKYLCKRCREIKKQNKDKFKDLYEIELEQGYTKLPFDEWINEFIKQESLANR